MIKLEDATARYPNGTVALHEVSLSVGERNTAILGANGAGKTSLLRVLSGTLPIEAGTLTISGSPVRRHNPRVALAHGTAHVPQGRELFPGLTVGQNLTLGGFTMRSQRHRVGERIQGVVEIFPRLGERMQQKAGSLSGGEQQMLAIGRALMSEPRHLMIDELSLGLAPMVTAQILEALADLDRRTGCVVTLVEQETSQALATSEYCYVLRNGRIAWHGRSSDLESQGLADLYLGDT